MVPPEMVRQPAEPPQPQKPPAPLDALFELRQLALVPPGGRDRPGLIGVRAPPPDGRDREQAALTDRTEQRDIELVGERESGGCADRERRARGQRETDTSCHECSRCRLRS